MSKKRKHSEADVPEGGEAFIAVSKEGLPKKVSSKKKKRPLLSTAISEAIDGTPPQKKKKKSHVGVVQKPGKKEKATLGKYTRGAPINVKAISDKKKRSAAKRTEAKFKDASLSAARAEILLVDQPGYMEAEGMERTYHFTQEAIRDNVDVANAEKAIDLKLELGPYAIDFSRNGRYLLMGGRKGHVALMDWSRGGLSCELQLRETVRDVRILHNHTMFAVAQKKYVHIYDQAGVEIHCLRNHIDVNRIDFLPYHFLMVTVGNAGYLKYQDTSTGQLIAEHRTRLGRSDAMKANPRNAIVHVGHSNGTVTLWSPNMTQYHVKMLCHRGPVLDLAFDPSGTYMVTTGADSQLTVWDIRTYKKVHSYFTRKPATTVDVSQKGALAVGWGAHVQVWQNALATKAKSPYMNHLYPGGEAHRVRFVPYEDFLGVGHRDGVSSLIVPGSGEPNYDSFVADPFETKRMRQEGEVKALLEKIQPDAITLDEDHIGRVERTAKSILEEEKRKEFEANNPNVKFQPKFKKRGRSSAMKRYLKKQENVIDKKRLEVRQKVSAIEKEREKAKQIAAGTYKEPKATVLDRFRSGPRT